MKVEQKKEVMLNSNPFQTVTNSNRKFPSQRQKKPKNKGNLIHADELTFRQNKNFFYQQFVIGVEKGKADMQNLILFQTVTNSGKKFVSQRQKKLKNKEDIIFAHEFNFQEIKIFLIKGSSSE